MESRVSLVNLQKLTFSVWEAWASMRMLAPAENTRSRAERRCDVDGVEGDVRAKASESGRVAGVLVEDADRAHPSREAYRVDADVGPTRKFVQRGKCGAENVP